MTADQYVPPVPPVLVIFKFMTNQAVPHTGHCRPDYVNSSGAFYPTTKLKADMSNHLLILGTAQLLASVITLLLTIAASYTYMAHLRNPNQCPANQVNCWPTVLTIIIPLTAADLLLQLAAASLTITKGKSNNKCIHTSSIVTCSMSTVCCFVTGIIFNQIPFLIFTFLSISDFIRCCINILTLVIIIRTINSGNNFISCSGSTDSVDNKQTVAIGEKKPSFFKNNLLTKLFKSPQETITQFSEIL